MLFWHEFHKPGEPVKDLVGTYLNTKVILDALDCKILAKGTELVIDILIVSFLLGPLGHKHPQGFLKDRLGADLTWVWSGSQAEVRLLNGRASALQKCIVSGNMKH